MDDGSRRSLCGSKWTKVVPQLKRKCETFAQRSSLYEYVYTIRYCVSLCVSSRCVYFGVLCCLDLVIVAQTSRADATIVCDFKAFDLSRAATISNGFITYHPIRARRNGREISINFNCGEFTIYILQFTINYDSIDLSLN